MNSRGFSQAIDENARVQLDFKANVYHLFFTIGTNSWKASSAKAMNNMQKSLFSNGYRIIDRQDFDRILTFAK